MKKLFIVFLFVPFTFTWLISCNKTGEVPIHEEEIKALEEERKAHEEEIKVLL